MILSKNGFNWKVICQNQELRRAVERTFKVKAPACCCNGKAIAPSEAESAPVNVLVEQEVARVKSYYFYKAGDAGKASIHTAGDPDFEGASIIFPNSVPTGFPVVFVFGSNNAAQGFYIKLNGVDWFTAVSATATESPAITFNEGDEITAVYYNPF